MKPAALLLVLLLVAACSTGAKQSSFARPDGEMVTVSLDRTEIVGELIAVATTGLVLRNAGFMEIPWDQIHDVAFDRLRGMNWPKRAIPSPATRERLRLVSRFPQGLDEAGTRRLLDAYKQDAIRICRAENGRVTCEVAR